MGSSQPQVFLEWKKIAETPSSVCRGSESFTLVGNRVYWAGSYGRLSVVLCTSWKWRHLGRYNLGIADSHVAQLVEDKIYFHGGTGFPVWAEFDTVLGTVRHIQVSGGGPAGSRFATSIFATWSDEIITFGGYEYPGQGMTNNVHAFNIHSKTWKKVYMRGKPPVPRISHASAVSASKMYIYGGKDSNTQLLGDLWVAEFESSSAPFWTLLKGSGVVPPPRCSTVLNNYKGLLIVFGGYGSHPSIRRELKVYSPELRMWLDDSRSQVVVEKEPPHKVYNHHSLNLSNGILYFTKSGVYILTRE